MRRRVVRLATRLNIGGPARQALLLTRALRPEWDTVLACGRPAPSEGEMSDPAVTVEHLPLVRPVSPGDDLRAMAAIRRLLVRERPQLVHTHMAKAGTIGRAAALTMRPRPKVVHTFHGHVMEGYFGATTRQVFLNAERALARATDVLVAISPEIRDELVDLGIGRPSQYRVIPLGFELDAHLNGGRTGAFRRDLGLGPDVPLIGIIGRLVPIKDHETMLRAMEQVPGAHLAVVGDGELRSELEHRVGQLGLRDRVHFTGWRRDVETVVADVDVVALSSRNEGTPVSLIEAAASGRAAVATDVGGVRSVVEHGVTGLLVRPGDPAALAEALRTLVDDPARREAMGERARAVAARYTSTRLVDDIRALYDELVPPTAD